MTDRRLPPPFAGGQGHSTESIIFACQVFAYALAGLLLIAAFLGFLHVFAFAGKAAGAL